MFCSILTSFSSTFAVTEVEGTLVSGSIAADLIVPSNSNRKLLDLDLLDSESSDSIFDLDELVELSDAGFSARRGSEGLLLESFPEPILDCWFRAAPSFFPAILICLTIYLC